MFKVNTVKINKYEKKEEEEKKKETAKGREPEPRSLEIFHAGV